MDIRVNIMRKALLKMREDLTPQFIEELEQVFPDAVAITVYDCFHGYSSDQERKVVLGVEVRLADSYHAHVVKLGTREAIASDYDGWRKCFAGRPFISRILVPVTRKELDNDRVAVIYQDAYQLYGEDVDAQPQNLETVVHWAVHDDKPNPISVERVIRQIYTDLYRWFYRGPKADEKAARAFYRRRLARALGRWRDGGKREELRRDLIWLFCGRDAPTAIKNVVYLDPYDYIQWIMSSPEEDPQQQERTHRRIPETLIGRSHGDLHGRNILVGIQRGEAEYPSIFDYNEMDDSNVLVWDFVKLETEIKTRLLMSLYEDKAARQTLLSLHEDEQQWKALIGPEEPSGTGDPRSPRVKQFAFAFEFESLLNALTDRIYRTADAKSPDPPGGRAITRNQKLDRALAIFIRIRQEAALCLGENQPHRSSRDAWKDEYYFALAVYGLATAKWDYKEFETGFALVSAGTALAQLSTIPAMIAEQLSSNPAPHSPYPCYRIPLVLAHRLWRAGKAGDALQILEQAVPQFPHAVPLLQEYGLMLTEARRYDEALKLLTPLQDLCRVFRDCETLSRAGRTYKSMGDRAWEDNPVPVEELSHHAASQFYSAAFERYSQAFGVADPKVKYYPGVNAATIALLRGMKQETERYAHEVLQGCATQDLGALDADDRFWVLASEGEASLVLQDSKAAATYYHQALAGLTSDQAGMAQSAYDQLCRLWQALGDELVGPVVAVFRNDKIWPHLKPGPLGNCGLPLDPAQPGGAGAGPQ